MLKKSLLDFDWTTIKSIRLKNGKSMDGSVLDYLPAPNCPCPIGMGMTARYSVYGVRPALKVRDRDIVHVCFKDGSYLNEDGYYPAETKEVEEGTELSKSLLDFDLTTIKEVHYRHGGTKNPTCPFLRDVRYTSYPVVIGPGRYTQYGKSDGENPMYDIVKVVFEDGSVLDTSGHHSAETKGR